MKKKLKGLIGLMSVCALGIVGGALALTRDGATAGGTTGNYDKAINLYWGGTSTSVTLDDCTDLTANTPVYRYFTVSPQSTKSVTGTVTVAFTLSQTTGDYHIQGLTVNVYRADAAISGTNIEEVKAVEANKVVTLNASHLTDNNTFGVTSDTAAHTTTKYYAVEVVYDGTYVANKVLGGQINISQSFGA